MAVGGGKIWTEEDKKYCKFCGKKLVKVLNGYYDEYDGSPLYRKECQNTACPVNKPVVIGPPLPRAHH
jgi:hypothetical protein